MSYLLDWPLEQSKSDVSGELQLSLRNGRLMLTAADVTYSFDDKYDNFTTAFNKIQPEKSGLKHVLVLGFGMGSIPYILSKTHGVEALYTGIELDVRIIDWAEKYSSRLASSFTLIEADACDWVGKANNESSQYDLIVVDIFVNDKVPACVESDLFLENCQSLLAPHGILLFNKLAQSQSQLEEATKFLNEVFLKVFPKGKAIKTRNNWVLVSN